MPSNYIVDDKGLARLNSDAGHGERAAPIGALLAIQDRRTRDRLGLAIRSAIEEHEATALVCPSDLHHLGDLVTVRPAREEGLAVVTVSSLDAPPESLRWPLLVEMFDITRAESEIAIALFRGSDLADIAVMRDVTLETVRGQVKSLLRKLGIPNQKRLTALLSRIALALPSPARPPSGGLQLIQPGL
jgi:DNA-binding NarL/FixJ family response regulator